MLSDTSAASGRFNSRCTPTPSPAPPATGAMAVAAHSAGPTGAAWWDGRPVSLSYTPGDGDGDGGRGGGLSIAHGHDVHPHTTWTHIPAGDIISCWPKHDRNSPDHYHFLYVEANPGVESDPTASPVRFQAATLVNPPHGLLAIDGIAPRRDFPQHPASVQPNFHVVVSTRAGTGVAADVWSQLVKPALAYVKVKHYALHYTTSESSVVEFTRDILLPQANLGVPQSVLLMSGDGGVVDLVNTVLSGTRSQNYKKPHLAILPLGTGNALAHGAGAAQDNTFGVKTWLRGRPRELPLFCASFSPGAKALVNEAREERQLHLQDGLPIAHGAVVCSWGIHAALVADSDTADFRRFGADRFRMAAKELLFPRDGSSPHVYRGQLSILRPGQPDWQTIRHGEHAYVLATLCKQLEKGFIISPHSRPLDGKLRLVHFGPTTGEQAMAIMGQAYQGGQHVDDERVGYEEIDALRIDFHEDHPRWRRVCIDGTIVRVEHGGWVEVRSAPKGVVDLIVE